MKVLIYTSPSKLHYVRLGRCSGTTKAGELWPPIKLMYLMGVARQRAEALFIDADAANMSHDDFIIKVKDFEPDIMITESNPCSVANDAKVLKGVKDKLPNVRSVLIGAFATAANKSLLEKYPIIDYVFAHEPEETLRKFLEGKNVSLIRGIYFRKKEEVIFTGKKEFIENLDKLPFPAHDLLDLNLYETPVMKRKPFTLTEIGRGCPYQCTYCNSYFMTGKKFRIRSNENIMEELRWIESLGIKEVQFNDESFTIKRQQIIDLMNQIIREKLDITWNATTRVDLVDDEMLGLMKKAGCHTIFYGIESGNQEIIDYYKKGISLEQAIKALKLTRRHGIITGAHFIFGAPAESWETVNRTIDFSKKLNPDFAAFNILTPFPDTELYNDLLSKNLICSSDWISYNQSENAPLRTEHLDSEELKKAVKMAYKKFYLQPRAIYNHLIKIKSYQDLVKNIKGFGGVLNLIKR